MGMSYPIACLCFDGRDEEELSFLIARCGAFEARIRYWNAASPPAIAEKVALIVSRDHVSLFREVPLAGELYPRTQFLVLVKGLTEKVAALPVGDNLWYAERESDPVQIRETVMHLILGTARKEKRAVVLTRREQEVFQLVAAGLTSREICSSLSIRRSTLNTYKKHLFLKFKVRSSAQMVAASSEALYQVGL